MGIWWSDLRATLSIKVRCRDEIGFLMLGISKNFLLTVSFVMCWYLTSAILVPNMCRMLRCRNNLSFFRRDARSAHLSHPHSNILMEMSRKMRYLLQLSMLVSVHNLARDPIDAFYGARRALML